MASYTKISFNIDNDLLKNIEDYVKVTPGVDKTAALNQYINEAINNRKKVEEQEKILNLVSLKTLFILREVTSLNEGLLEEIDQKFLEKLPDLKEMIIDEGMDYVGS